MYIQQQQPTQAQQQPLNQNTSHHISSSSPVGHMPQNAFSTGANFQFANMGGPAMPQQLNGSAMTQPNFVSGQMLAAPS